MANLRVLVADSDPEVREKAQRDLAQQGYFIVPAADGNEALAHMQNGSLDVVVAQVALPKHNGLEILRAAREKSTPLPVILLADQVTIGAAANGVRAGAFDYLVKPLDDMTRLAILIDRAAGQSPTPRRIASPAPTATAPGELAPESKPGSLLDALTQEQDLNVFLNQVAVELARSARASHVFILLPHNDGQLHLTVSHGFTTSTEATRTYTNNIGENFALRVASAKTVKWLPLTANPSAQDTLGIPLLFQNQIMGIAIAQNSATAESF